MKGSNESLNNSKVSMAVPIELDNQLYINKCNIQSSSNEIHKSFSVSFSEEHKPPSTTTDESNDSNSSENKQTQINQNIDKQKNNISSETKINISTTRPARKLPEIPICMY